MRVLIDAKELRARATGVARYEREILAGITKSLEATVVVRRGALADGSADVVQGRLIALPDRLPSTVIEQVVMPVCAWLMLPEILHTLAGAQSVVPMPGRRILTLHEDRAEYFKRYPPTGSYRRAAARWGVWSAERTARRAAVVFTVSQTAAAELEASGVVDRERIVPIQHGVSDVFHPDSSVERGAFVLMLASGDPRDDPRAVVEAVGALGTAADLVVAGRLDREAEGRIQSDADECRVRVTFAGEVSDEELACLYRTCLCFVHASDYEGFGLAVLEAMACGAVVVARPSPALTEVAGSIALTGRTSTEIGELLVTVAHDVDRREELGRAGIERAQMFTWHRAAQMTLEGYGKAQ